MFRDAFGCMSVQREGLPPTGILATISKRAGFDSVSALLQQNPAAKRPSPPRTPPLTTPLSPRATQVNRGLVDMLSRQARALAGPSLGFIIL